MIERTTTGLFAGIGGIELGFERAGYRTEMLVENYQPAYHVLRRRFPETKLHDDVRTLDRLPDHLHLLTAGFPCQDLSSVGPKRGIAGTRSSLVGEVFRLLEDQRVPWLLLENVPFILDLDRGRALTLITSALQELGYRWAYRVIDAAAFGLPQRRRRWFLLATTTEFDPRTALLSQDSPPARLAENTNQPSSFGFYWTEGTRALGWADDSIPPLKCGSTIGIASPPAVLLPSREIVTPDIRDAERLQGFRAGWTKPAEEVTRPNFRWKLVGNAVSVRTAAWIAGRVATPGEYDSSHDTPIEPEERWPRAAWWDGQRLGRAMVSEFPVRHQSPPIHEFFNYPGKPLSARAARGFLSRAEKGSLRFVPGFLQAVRDHAAAQEAGT